MHSITRLPLPSAPPTTPPPSTPTPSGISKAWSISVPVSVGRSIGRIPVTRPPAPARRCWLSAKGEKGCRD